MILLYDEDEILDEPTEEEPDVEPTPGEDDQDDSEEIFDVKTLLINTLITEFGYPVILQGSMPEDEGYPESFFTFFNNDTVGDGYYDNEENMTIWDFDLNFYSTDPSEVNTTLLTAKKKLKAEGFIVDGKGYDVISDEPTHTGRGINLIYMEREENDT